MLIALVLLPLSPGLILPLTNYRNVISTQANYSLSLSLGTPSQSFTTALETRTSVHST